jgi:hypothetical protein
MPSGVGADVVLGTEPVDGIFTRPVNWNLGGSSWVAWSADPRFVVSAGAGGPERHRFVLPNADQYEVTVIGQTTSGLAIRKAGPRPGKAHH